MSLTLTQNPEAHCSLLRQFSHELTWVPERDYVAASEVELRVERRRSFLCWRYVELQMPDGDVTFRWKVEPTTSELRTNPERILLRAKMQYGARRGEAYRFLLRAIPPTWAGIDLELAVWTIGPSNASQVDAERPPAEREDASTCVLPVVAGPVERLCLYARPAANASGRVRIVVSPQDRFGNPGRFSAPVNLVLNTGDENHTLAVTGTTDVTIAEPDVVMRPTARVPMAELGPNENVSNGIADGDCLVVTGNPFTGAAGADQRLPVFGEFHWHTNHSGDGQRPIREALRCARDELNLDYAAPGDHNTGGEKWTDTVAALEEFDDPGAFATFFGWEASSKQGHENLYFTDPNHPLVCGGEAGYTGGKPHNHLETLQAHSDFIAVPHHTNAVSETRRITDGAPFWHPYSWTDPTPAHRLVEIFQIRGNQERNDYTDAWGGWHQHNGASVQDALAKGYRLGFTGGTDNHCGWPGRAFARCEGIGMHPPYSQILTGIWVSGRERQAVYDGLAARHTWAVWNTRAVVWFTVNDALMGDELRLAQGEQLTARLCINAESAFQTVEMVSDGNVLWQRSFAEPDIDESVTLDTPGHDTHVYVRALLRNGGILYASPVFIALS